MKRNALMAMAFMASLAGAASCNKIPGTDVPGPEKEIILQVEASEVDINTVTRATEISSIPGSLYWLASSGTWKSETLKYPNATASVALGKINTGKYQTLSPTAYNYYLSNASMTFAAGGSTIYASGDTDVIAGCTGAATASTAPSVTLDHVFARTGTFTCITQTTPISYELSDVSWKIQSKAGGTGGTAGTYNIALGKGQGTGTGWSDVTALAQTAVTNTSDMYLVPGMYTVTVTYTLTKGDYVETFTKSGDVTLVAGKVNNITCTAIGGNAQEIVIGVSLSPWGSNPVTLTL